MSIEDTDERAVIGCAINGMVAGIKMLTAEDYEEPNNRIIADVIMGLLQKGIGIEPLTVTGELERRGALRQVGGALAIHGLADIGNCYNGFNASYFAGEVRTAARIRRLAQAAEQLAQFSRAEAATEYTDEMVTRFRQQLDNLPPELGGTPEDESRYWAKTIRDTPDDPDEWLIPGLLARGTDRAPGGDRIMVTGVEGFGKSAFVMQIAACAAAGLNPFNGARVSDGLRVLTIDCENPERRVKSGLRMMTPRIRRCMYAPDWDERWSIIQEPAGINLNSAKDLATLRNRADRHQPDLIVIGPFYKLMRGDPNKEADVLQVLYALDDLRVRLNAAVIIEAHSGNASGGSERPVRPMGSSAQMRWPEIGFGIRPDERPEYAAEREWFAQQMKHPRVTHMECVGWRGQREDRDWPPYIRYGQPHEMPWVPTHDWAPSVDLGYQIQQELTDEG